MLRTQQVIFPLAAGEAVQAVQVVLSRGDDGYGFVVDAETGEILLRNNLVNNQSQTASFRVFNADSPAPGTPWLEAPVTEPSNFTCGGEGSDTGTTDQPDRLHVHQ